MTTGYKQAVELMGKCVVVVEQLERQVSDDKKVTWLSLPVKPRVGWVTGIRYKQCGEVVPGSRYVGWGGDVYDPPTFRQYRTVPALLVVYWPNLNPVLVPLDGFRAATADERPHPSGYQWSERDREDLREAMKDTPRDAKGRFVKEGS